MIVETIRKTIDKVRPQFAGREMTEWRLPVFWKYFDPARKRRTSLHFRGMKPAELRDCGGLGLSPAAVRHHGGEEWVGLMELTPNHPV